jgi:hypothetical protein
VEGPYPFLKLSSDPKKGLTLSPPLRQSIQHCCDLHFTYRRTLLGWHSYQTKKLLCVTLHLGLRMVQCSKLFIAHRRTLLFDIKWDILNKYLPLTRYWKLKSYEEESYIFTISCGQGEGYLAFRVATKIPIFLSYIEEPYFLIWKKIV